MNYDLFLSKEAGKNNQVFVDCKKTYYLVPNTNYWTKPSESNYRFALYYVEGGNTHWYSLSQHNSENLYTCTIVWPSANDITTFIFCRMWGDNPTNNWETKRDQTGDLSWQSSKNEYRVPDGWTKQDVDDPVDWNNNANWYVHA